MKKGPRRQTDVVNDHPDYDAFLAWLKAKLEADLEQALLYGDNHGVEPVGIFQGATLEFHPNCKCTIPGLDYVLERPHHWDIHDPGCACALCTRTNWRYMLDKVFGDTDPRIPEFRDG